MATVTAGIAPREIHERIEQTLTQERFIDLEQGRCFTTKEIYHDIERAALEVAERLGEKHHRGRVGKRPDGCQGNRPRTTAE